MRAAPRPDDRRRRPGGFTLIELGVVIVIISLLASFILVVALEGIERAKERATQSLITKLDLAMNDRMAALLSRQVRSNYTQRWLAMPQGTPLDANGLPPESARADLIARIDFLRAELPDVFFLQVDPASLSASSGVVYPLNFAGLRFDRGTAQSANHQAILPLGNAVLADYANGSPGSAPLNLTPQIMRFFPGYSRSGTGIYGASYTAMAGILKNLGTAPRERLNTAPSPYLPTGYDGVDNNDNGFVDEFFEGIDGGNLEAVRASLRNHHPRTARSETLYAVLVESAGALLSRDSFTSKEVQDTDGDGLPEFVDGWGNPLLFFRWPLFYHSDSQRGLDPRGFDGIDNNGDGNVDFPNDLGEAGGYDVSGGGAHREKNPLDPNNLLLAPGWWSDFQGTPQYLPYPGDKSKLFQTHFFSLSDPLSTPTVPDPPLPSRRWERNGFFKRRAFAFKHLILSAGPDGYYGTPILPDALVKEAPTSADPQVQYANDSVVNFTLIENRAGQFHVDSNSGWQNNTQGFATMQALRLRPNANPGIPERSALELIEFGRDDITNHNLRVTGSALR